MKKTILSLCIVASGFYTMAQVIVSGISPANVQGSYDFGVQVGAGIWPGETDNATWGAITTDFNIPGNYIQAELAFIEDGTPGTNAQGNPVSQEGCSPAINDLSSKIAVIYRNECDFASKVFNAQVAGALAVIIVNREDEMIGMTADPAGDGPNVTIPAVAITATSGNALISEMANGPVVVLIGNKSTAFPNDLSSEPADILISKQATQNSNFDNKFDLGIQIYNHGALAQNAATVNATITGPTSEVYNETITLDPMANGDTAFIFAGNPLAFPAFDLGMGNYENGDYTLVYTLTPDATDDFPYDNVFTSTFSISNDYISLAHTNAAGEPLATSFPTPDAAFTEYKTCMFFQDENASNLGVKGLSFVPYSDTSQFEFVGKEIAITISEWNDVWTDINDQAIAFTSLNDIVYENHYPNSDDETGLPVYMDISNPFVMVDNQRYLVCLQSFDPELIFGSDGSLNYGANLALGLQPISPLFSNDPNANQWYAAGWSSGIAPSITLHTFDAAEASISEEASVKGIAFPNPTKENVRISLEASGNGVLNITDLAGKVVATTSITLVNGTTNVDMESLENGMYIFNVELESGQTSQFNVVKQ